MRVLLIALLIPLQLYGDAFKPEYQVSLGFWTYHFNRKQGDCENHKLIGIGRDEYGIGTYINSHCQRSYFLTVTRDFWRKGRHTVGWRSSLTTGYPPSMRLIGPFTPIPMLRYTYQVNSIGVAIHSVPGILVGAGYYIKF